MLILFQFARQQQPFNNISEASSFNLSFKQYNKVIMWNTSQSQQQEENRHHTPLNQTFNGHYTTSLSRLFQNHQALVGAHFSQTYKQPWHNIEVIPDKKSNRQSRELPLEQYKPIHSQKARLVREIQLKIAVLESKSKQPGIKYHDLQPLGHQIYDKLDEYFISFGNQRARVQPYDKTAPLNDKSNKNNARLNQQIHTKTYRQNDPEHVRTIKDHKKQTSMLSESDISRIKPASSNIIVEESNRDEVPFRKMYNTTANLSFSSLSDIEPDHQERPFFETRMSESALEGLECHTSRELSDDKQDIDNLNESYYELKETIRVMEERIAFLIYRLQENKKEITSLREINKGLEESLGEEQKKRKDIRRILDDKKVDLAKAQEQNQALEKKVKQLSRQHLRLDSLADKRQKEAVDLRGEIEYLKAQINQRQTKIQHVQMLLKLKSQQLIQLWHAYHNIEKQWQLKQQTLLNKLSDLQKQKELLCGSIKQYKIRLQTEGLSFNLYQALRLKQLFEESDRQHQRQVTSKVQANQRRIRQLNDKLSLAIKQKESLESAVSELIRSYQQSDIQSLSQPDSIRQFKAMAEHYKQLVVENKQMQTSLQKYQDRLGILKEECNQKYNELRQLQLKISNQQSQIKQLHREKAEIVQYLTQHVCEPTTHPYLEEKTSKLCNSRLDSKIVEIKLGRNGVDQNAQMTLQFFIKKKMLTSVSSILKFAVKFISFALELQQTHKKKLPCLAPHAVLLTLKNISEIEIIFSIIAKKEQEQGLIYQAPQIVLGFNESASSHCWTIGLIIDELLHGRRYFKSFTDILSHKDNYSITDDKYRKLTVLTEMLKKNHKVRIGLEPAKARFQDYIMSLKSKR